MVNRPSGFNRSDTTLGAVYLKNGKYSEAERVYREDLAKWPKNGWSLYGLGRALEQQGKTEAAKKVMAEHTRIWAKADVPIATSCLCIPENVATEPIRDDGSDQSEIIRRRTREIVRAEGGVILATPACSEGGHGGCAEARWVRYVLL